MHCLGMARAIQMMGTVLSHARKTYGSFTGGGGWADDTNDDISRGLVSGGKGLPVRTTNSLALAPARIGYSTCAVISSMSRG
jgi:hypothetical protein